MLDGDVVAVAVTEVVPVLDGVVVAEDDGEVVADEACDVVMLVVAVDEWEVVAVEVADDVPELLMEVVAVEETDDVAVVVCVVQSQWSNVPAACKSMTRFSASANRLIASASVDRRNRLLKAHPTDAPRLS